MIGPFCAHVILFVGLAVSTGLSANGQMLPANRRHDWPQIKLFEQNFRFSSDSPYDEAVIESPDGKPLYRFVCHEGGYEDGATGDYNSLFQCKLFSLVISKERFLDLFLPSYSWGRSRTRATFNDGLGDKCDNHPYYGHKRTFNLRGMRIELTVSDFRASPGIAESLKRDLAKPDHYSLNLHVRVTPAPEATNPIAGTVPEVCEVGYSLGKTGQVVETVHHFPDPAKSSPKAPSDKQR